MTGVRIVCGATWLDAPSFDEVRAGRAVIKQGMRGKSVEAVQAMVGTPADGDFGDKTRNAVVTFQLMRRIGATGEVDQNTMIAIDHLAGGRLELPGYRPPTAPPVAPPTAPTAPAPPVSPPNAAATPGAAPPPPAGTALTPRPEDKPAKAETPFYEQPVPGTTVPVWQAALGGLAVAAVATGVYLLARPKPSETYVHLPTELDAPRQRSLAEAWRI